MQRFVRTVGVGVMFLLLVLLATGCAYDSDGKAVFGGAETIHSGEVVDGDLAVFGGAVTVEEGAIVNGDLAIFGGTVSLDGEVTGDVVNFGGTIARGADSAIGGEIATFGGTTRRAERVVEVEAPEEMAVPEEVEAPEAPEATEAPAVTTRVVRPSLTDRMFGLVAAIVGTVLKTVAFGALGLVLALFLPDHVRRVGHAAGEAPAASMGVGCLAIPALVLLSVITAITIIGIPLTVLLVAASGAAVIFGWIGLGLFFGDRLLRAADVRSPRPAAAAAIGSGGLVLVSSAVGVIPILGWLVSPVLTLWALGATILTRGGTKSYPTRPRIDQPVPPLTIDPLADIPPAPRRDEGQSRGRENLFADLAADLGIEDEVYGENQDDEDVDGRETPVSPPDEG
ncbi:MAG: hypothetical protein M3220_05850 [Chloroflexota bacterium]|nr:hypothetical protein [Chloroflexota bacterium]